MQRWAMQTLVMMLVGLTGVLTGGNAQAPALSPTAHDVARMRIVVQGSVAKPGVYQVDARARLLDVIAMAGGLTVKPEAVQLVVTRGQAIIAATPATEMLTNHDLNHNIALQTDDIVAVTPNELPHLQARAASRQISVAITGEVQKPGVYTISYHTNLQDLIMLAGGVTEAARLSKLEVVRGDVRIPVDAYAALRENGPRLDVPSEDGDMIIIPRNRERFCVIGAVTTPGFHYLPEKGHLTLAQAIQLAGGLRRQPDGSQLEVTISHRLPNGNIARTTAVPEAFIATYKPGIHSDDIITVNPLETNRTPQLRPIPPAPNPFAPREDNPPAYLWFLT